MARKRVSSLDLSWMIFDRMREQVGSQRPISVAVIPDRDLGWRAVFDSRSRRSLSSAAVRKLNLIEKELRSAYVLAD